MSRLVVNNGFEIDALPFTALNQMVISATNKINGATSLRGGDSTAKDGTAVWVIPRNQQPESGGRRALRVQGRFQFKRVTVPSAGTLYVLRLNGSGGSYFGVYMDTGGIDKLRSQTGAYGATALGTAARDIRFDYREEGIGSYPALFPNRVWFRLWLDGVIEFDQRGAAMDSFGIGAVTSIEMGLTNLGKSIWEVVWDDMNIRFSSDPQ